MHVVSYIKNIPGIPHNYSNTSPSEQNMVSALSTIKYALAHSENTMVDDDIYCSVLLLAAIAVGRLIDP